MKKTATFILAIFSITLLACVASKTYNLKHKKIQNSKSREKFLSPALDNSTKSLNFAKLYPIVDKSYEEAWNEAENSSFKDKYYFCSNLTLAKTIHQEIHDSITNFRDDLDIHRERLEKHRNNPTLRVNNKASLYKLKESNTDYDKFLGELSRNYQNKYIESIDKIEQILEDNESIAKDLTSKCQPFKELPQNTTVVIKNETNPQTNPETKPQNTTVVIKNETNPQTNPETKPEATKTDKKPTTDTKPKTVSDADSSNETLSFLEFKANSKNMSRNEKEVFNVLIQMYQRVSKIINKYNY